MTEISRAFRQDHCLFPQMSVHPAAETQPSGSLPKRFSLHSLEAREDWLQTKHPHIFNLTHFDYLDYSRTLIF